MTAAYVVIASKMGTNAYPPVIASEAKQSIYPHAEAWITSSRSLSSGAHSRDPLAPRNDASVVQLMELQEQGWSYVRS